MTEKKTHLPSHFASGGPWCTFEAVTGYLLPYYGNAQAEEGTVSIEHNF